MTTTSTLARTPSEWLLARYDRILRRNLGPQGNPGRTRDVRGSNFDRQLFEVINDHVGQCELDQDGDCALVNGEARWPKPAWGDDLGDEDPLERLNERWAAAYGATA